MLIASFNEIVLCKVEKIAFNCALCVFCLHDIMVQVLYIYN